jgi:hypothetical protein
VAKALNRPIDCSTIFYNPVVENLESTYDNLRDTYDILINIYNNYSIEGTNPGTYFHDLYNTLISMYPKLGELMK